jgi:hypothetical protein
VKYCIPYFTASKNLDKADEISIKYEYMSNLVSLIDFLKEHSNQRVIISLPFENGKNVIKEEDLKNFELIKDYNFVIKLHFDRKIAADLKIRGIPFYFTEGCGDWDAVHSFIKLGVSDILIINELGFSIKQVAEFAHSKGINVRVYPNIALASYNETSEVCRFFILPHNIKDYEPYVDICEIYGDLELVDSLYDIYAIQKNWGSLINFIIMNFNRKILTNFLPTNFIKRRLDCEKKCLKGGRCHACETYAGLAEELTKIKFDQYEKKRKI